METNFEQLLDKVAANVKEMVKTETVLGEEFKIGDFTCKPVIRVGLGFGSGGGNGDKGKSSKCNGEGAGAGAGIGITPVGFLVAKGSEISFIPTDHKKGLNVLFEKVPDLIEKIMEMKNEKEEKSK